MLPRSWGVRWRTGLSALLVGLLAQGSSRPASGFQAEPPPAEPAEAGPADIYILRQGEDLPALLKRLGSPDFVLTPQGGAAPPIAVPPLANAATATGVTSVEVMAVVEPGREVARARIVLGLVSRAAGPAAVPIGLQGLYPRRARDLATGQDLGWEADPRGRWTLRLPGPGERRVEVEVDLPVRAADERRSLSVPLPESASTTIRLDLPYDVDDATTRDGAPIVVSPRQGAEGARIEAVLPPSPGVELSWLPRLGPAEIPAPLVTAQGDIDLTVGPRQLVARSNWVLLARRGEARSLRFRLEEGEELEAVEADGRSLAVAPVGSGGGQAGDHEITLPEPLRKGATLSLSITSRRSLAASAADGTFTFRGHPFVGIADQTGLLSVAPASEPLRVRAEPRGGLTRIDPRQLSDLRSRPSLARVFQFNSQPFELGLSAEPATPRLQVATETAITLERSSARVASRLDYRVMEGEVLEVRAGVPAGLQILEAGPADRVASWEVEPPAPAAGEPAVLRVTLRETAREGMSFRLEVSGRAAGVIGTGEAASEITVPIPGPIDGLFTGGEVGVWSGASTRVSLAPAVGLAEETPAEDSAGASGTAPDAPPGLLLVQEMPVAAVPLRLESVPRRVIREIRLEAVVGPAGVKLSEDLTCTVADGQLTELELAVPVELDGRWTLARNPEVARQEPLGRADDGSMRYRLRLVRPVADATLRLEFEASLALGELPEGPGGAVRFPWIEAALPGVRGPLRVEVAPEPGVEVRPAGDGWFPMPAESAPAAASTSVESAPVARPAWAWAATGGPTGAVAPAMLIRPRELVDLPPLVASRAWLRTTQGEEGDRFTVAWFRVEAHRGEFVFGLPAGAVLENVVVAGQVAAEVERADGAGSYRIALPRGGEPGLVVGLSYSEDETGGPWLAPRLVDGRLQQTLWEVRVPWSRALVGSPAGWTDENRWYWADYVWKRRPWKEVADMSAWIGGPGTRPDQLSPRVEASTAGGHSYLFGRTGDAPEIRALIVSRAAMVGFCSGALLAGGLGWLSWKPVPRWAGAAALAALLGAVVLVEPSTIFQVVQSSAVGLVLLAVAAATRRAVDRRRGAAAGPWDRAVGGSTYPIGSGVRPGADAAPGSRPSVAQPQVGSDDSTAIRPRPAVLDLGPATVPAPAPPFDVVPRGSTTRSHPNLQEGRASEVLEVPFSLGPPGPGPPPARAGDRGGAAAKGDQ